MKRSRLPEFGISFLHVTLSMVLIGIGPEFSWANPGESCLKNIQTKMVQTAVTNGGAAKGTTPPAPAAGTTTIDFAGTQISVGDPVPEFILKNGKRMTGVVAGFDKNNNILVNIKTIDGKPTPWIKTPFSPSSLKKGLRQMGNLESFLDQPKLRAAIREVRAREAARSAASNNGEILTPERLTQAETALGRPLTKEQQLALKYSDWVGEGNAQKILDDPSSPSTLREIAERHLATQKAYAEAPEYVARDQTLARKTLLKAAGFQPEQIRTVLGETPVAPKIAPIPEPAQAKGTLVEQARQAFGELTPDKQTAIEAADQIMTGKAAAVAQDPSVPKNIRDLANQYLELEKTYSAEGQTPPYYKEGYLEHNRYMTAAQILSKAGLEKATSVGGEPRANRQDISRWLKRYPSKRYEITSSSPSQKKYQQLMAEPQAELQKTGDLRIIREKAAELMELQKQLNRQLSNEELKASVQKMINKYNERDGYLPGFDETSPVQKIEELFLTNNQQGAASGGRAGGSASKLKNLFNTLKNPVDGALQFIKHIEIMVKNPAQRFEKILSHYGTLRSNLEDFALIDELKRRIDAGEIKPENPPPP